MIKKINELNFIFERKSYLTTFGSLIYDAIENCYSVNVYLLISNSIDNKSYQNFHDASFPEKLNDANIILYNNNDELYNFLTKKNSAICITWHSWRYFFGDKEKKNKIKFIQVQHGIDFLGINSLEDFYSSDLIFFYTKEWISRAKDYYKELNLSSYKELAKKVFNKSRIIGEPKKDLLRHIEKENVRSKFKIPKDKKVVLFFPPPIGINPGYWYKCFETNSLMTRLIYFVAGCLKEKRFFMFFKAFFIHNVCIYSLIKSIKQFTENNNAILLVKEKKKSNENLLFSKEGINIIYDESWFPPTFLELQSIADVFIHSYSTATLEAAYCDTYSINIQRPLPYFRNKYLFYQSRVVHKFWRYSKQPNPYNFNGVNKSFSMIEGIQKLPKIIISTLKLDEKSKSKYLDIFVASKNSSSFKNLINGLNDLVI